MFFLEIALVVAVVVIVLQWYSHRITSNTNPYSALSQGASTGSSGGIPAKTLDNTKPVVPIGESPKALPLSGNPMPARSLDNNKTVIPIGESPKAWLRKAPPPPGKIIVARALYGFEPENKLELKFAKGDHLEITEKPEEMEMDGWCRARKRYHRKIGLVPLKYLEELGSEYPETTIFRD